ncbi:MAG: oligosaccharide flippase family protein [Nitrospinaceae bacterium]|nr:oligosaccharide flippase family protein [Nitrospinaceae bacterium]NIR55753.1 oligosaccharide flippase family protein [Nitrospinaceae bacterium]NIS86194.1 oligosaccharide flippase family protein [Nitrospinaceae bacterium]NIT83032.1 oligosaccharide flippase family protein [Nitrospinaceae bacterium]NIU45245.1 oligosaccharide flippase family protein [Nitrospinaceae bacterium]
MKPDSKPIADNNTSWVSRIRYWLKNTLPEDLTQKVAETFSTRIFLIFASLITSILVARSLGPEGRGLYALALTIGMIGVQFSNLGLHSSNTFYIAREPGLMPALLGNSLAVSFVVGGICSLVGAVLFYLFPEAAPVQGDLLFLALAWIPFGLAFLLTQNLLIGIQEMRSFNKIEIANKSAAIILILILIGAGKSSAETLFSCGLAAMILSLFLVIKSLRRHLARSPHISMETFKNNLPYGIKSYLGSFIAFLLLRIDLLMVDHLMGKRETGLYDIAINLGEMVYLFPLVVSTVLFPKLSALKDVREKWQLSKNVGKGLLIVMVGLCALAAAVAHPAVHILYGKAFLGCIPVFIILVLSKFVMSVNSIYSNFVASIHVPWSLIPFGLLVLGVNVALNWILILKMGILGAALASVVSFALLIPFHFYYTMKYLQAESTPAS